MNDGYSEALAYNGNLLKKRISLFLFFLQMEITLEHEDNDNDDIFLDPQLIYKKKIAELQKTFQEYLKIPWPEPSANDEFYNLSKEVQQERLKEAAQMIQHFGENSTKEETEPTERPILQREIKIIDPEICWHSIKRYEICIHGNRQVLQKGDYVLLDDGKKGLVQYFTQDGVIFVHLKLIYVREDLSPVWKTFIKTSDEYIETDIDVTVPLGRVIERFDAHQPSYFMLQNNSLCARENDHKQSYSRTLIESYLTVDSELLMCHPLVQRCARFIHVLFKAESLAQLIFNDFSPFSAALSRDVEDTKIYEFENFAEFRMIGLKEDVCGFCTQHQKLVFDQNGATACDSCYVRLRKIYHNIFKSLEPCRALVKSQKSLSSLSGQHEETMEELCVAVKNIAKL
jgi:hypothetical protein